MKTLIKKNIYHAQDFGSEYEGRDLSYGSAYMGERGFTFGGSSSGAEILYFNIGTAIAGVSTTDFGDLGQTIERPASLSSRYRIVRVAGNVNPTGSNTNQDVIDYFTAGSTGSARDFGDYLYVTQQAGACSDGTRGIIGAGSTTPGVNTATNTMGYITINNASDCVEAGILSESRHSAMTTSDGNRAIFASGTAAPAVVTTMDYTTFISLASCVDFGEITQGRNACVGAASDGSRGIFMGGGNPNSDTIDFINCEILSHAADFGNLTSSRGYNAQMSNGSRAVTAHGEPGDGTTKDYVNIGTFGNAVDAGEMSINRTNMPGGSSGN